MVEDTGEVESPADVRVTAADAVEGGGDLGLVEAIEQNGEVGEGEGEVADVVTRLGERLDGGFEQGDGGGRIAVDGFEAGGFTGQDRLPNHDAVIASDDEALMHGV